MDGKYFLWLVKIIFGSEIKWRDKKITLIFNKSDNKTMFDLRIIYYLKWDNSYLYSHLKLYKVNGWKIIFMTCQNYVWEWDKVKCYGDNSYILKW